MIEHDVNVGSVRATPSAASPAGGPRLPPPPFSVPYVSLGRFDSMEPFDYRRTLNELNFEQIAWMYFVFLLLCYVILTTNVLPEVSYRA
jgi:hypothetical protein